MPLIKIVEIHGQEIELIYYPGSGGWVTADTDIATMEARRREKMAAATHLSRQQKNFFSQGKEYSLGIGDMPLDEHGVGRRRN